MFDTVVFDLDGTLVDSAPGIVASIIDAARSEGHFLDYEQVRRCIGPPAARLLQELLPDVDQSARERMQAVFRRRYDAGGYLASRLYDGCMDCLQALVAHGKNLMIATNKPEAPAVAMLGQLGITDFFVSVVSSAAESGSQPKSKAVARVLGTLARRGVVMVGDSLDDQVAASDNGIDFVLATWGYRSQEVEAVNPLVCRAGCFEDLRAILGAQNRSFQ